MHKNAVIMLYFMFKPFCLRFALAQYSRLHTTC